MDDHACTDCGVTVAGHVGAVRLVGREGSGQAVKLCGRCYVKRGEDARPLLPAAAPARSRR